ncbi:MAG: hypothetical protein PWP35_288 [Bacteroidales bacterium]|jgi:lipopolysaccharide/colanic/teichoic acid biosynthesis glycosyltransferase|nr:hypothetical protein [Bacteroidales bacterium]NPV37613.1 sugar transferase [Bacteroidales bacterium]
MQATANQSKKAHLPGIFSVMQPGTHEKGQRNMRKKILIVTIDVFYLFVSFVVSGLLINQEEWGQLKVKLLYFLIVSGAWLGLGLFFDKYAFHRPMTLKQNVSQIILTNLAGIGILFSVFYVIPEYSPAFKFLIVFGFLVSLLELLSVASFKALFKGTDSYLYEGPSSPLVNNFKKGNPIPENLTFTERSSTPQTDLSELQDSIEAEVGKEVFQFIYKHLGTSTQQILVISTTTRFNILSQPPQFYHSIVNLKKINNVQYINKFFEAVNTRIPFGGLFIGTAETYVQRKQRILARYPKGLNWIIYTFDFIIKRLMPKLWFTKKIYFFFTRGNNRVISMAETFGRLYSCGFEVVEDCFIDGQLWFCVRKVKEPSFDPHPTYGPLIRLKRVGKGGKIIGVYKFRTMHAYAEYLQQYVYERNKLQAGGKFKDDFRITTIGKFMRKFWLDELPMFINVIKGDLKIVGVRPLSKHYLSLYTPELQQWRMKHKPGLIPPFYVDLPKSLEEIMESEIKYLKSYERSPFLTDFSYLMKALYNIFIKKARSN